MIKRPQASTSAYDVLRATLVALVPDIDGVSGVVGGMDAITIEELDKDIIEIVVPISVFPNAKVEKIVNKVSSFVEKVVAGTLGMNYIVRVVVLVEDVSE
ncbi:hypothetical protein GM182_04715 [bacterium 3DAC]|jgi:hypothetical protein|nr:hypothetical protein [Dictyoglomota bacterium]UZN23188.1 hypothetical protein GM182_04715 [bacterium 3DAC]